MTTKHILRYFVGVLGLLLGIAALSAYSSLRDLSYARDTATVLAQFSPKRTPLVGGESGFTLCPEHIGDFSRQSFNQYDKKATDGLIIDAVYKRADGKAINIAVWETDYDPVRLVNSDLIYCGDVGGTTESRMDALFPHRYGVCQSWGFEYYEFLWLNANRVFQASSHNGTDVEPLIQFANSYPY